MFYASRQEKLEEAHVLNVKAVQLEPETLGFRISTANVLEREDLFPRAIGVLKTAKNVAKTPDETAMIQNLLEHAQQHMAANEAARARQEQGSDEVVVTSVGDEADGRGCGEGPGRGQGRGLQEGGREGDWIRGGVAALPVGRLERAAAYGARRLRGVQCSYPSVLALSVEQPGVGEALT